MDGAPLRRKYWLNETVYANIIQAYKKRTKKILEMLAEDGQFPSNLQLDIEIEELFTFYRRLAIMGVRNKKTGF